MKTLHSILSAVLLTATLSCTRSIAYEQAAAEFADPSPVHGVSCWWWWLNGNVDSAAILSELEGMKSKNFYGAMIFDAGGYDQCGNNAVPAGPQFGSPQWCGLFRYALDHAERLGMEMGFNIQSGWNLGGPCVTTENAAKMVVCSDTLVTGGGKCSIALRQPETRNGFYREVAVLAFPVSDDRISSEPIHFLEQKLSIHELGGSAPDCRFLLDNTLKDPAGNFTGVPYIVRSCDVQDVSRFMDSEGNFRWDVPDGKWAVMRVGYTCTGAVVSTSSDTWKGLVLDYLKPEAIDMYLKTVVDPILEAAGDHVGRTLKYMETDSWECGGMNWTDDFQQQFASLNGYGILEYLPVIGGCVVDDMDCTSAFLADFRKTVGYAVANNHYRRFAEYAHQRGMGIQPESAGPHAGPFDGVRNFSFSDIVMGEFWSPSPHRPRPCDRFFMKQASSAAHIYGKKIVGAESFTTIGPHWNDEIWHNQKSAFDHEICAGLNRVYFHTFTSSPASMGLPGQDYFAGTHVNPRVTWWKEASGFISYMSRVQSLVQEASFCGDILYYYGDHIPVIYPFKHADMAGAMPGFDYDVASEDALLKCTVDRDGSIVVPSGLKYRVLVLPDHKVLSMAVLEKTASLLESGATVIGAKPEKSVSLNGGGASRERFRELSGRIWGDPSEKGTKEYGKGKAVWGMTAREYLLSSGLNEDFAVDEDPHLDRTDFIHYVLDGHDVYCIANTCDSMMDLSCRFRSAGRVPELWDAETGRITQLGTFTSSDGITSVPLRLDPFGNAIVVFGEKTSDAAGKGKGNWKEYAPVIDVKGPWKVSFDPRWGGPEETVFDTLSDWTLSDDEGIRYYSGHASYSSTFGFQGETDPAMDYCIDLGSVKDVGMATVKVNGKDAGLAWKCPFRLDVGGLLKEGVNTVEITVVNSWYNRVAGDQIHPEGKQYTSTNIVIGHDFRGNILPDVKLSPSGLLGPVRILSAPK